MLKGFKEFLLRGNVADLAVAVDRDCRAAARTGSPATPGPTANNSARRPIVRVTAALTTQVAPTRAAEVRRRRATAVRRAQPADSAT
jgi:hypothetical protein